MTKEEFWRHVATKDDVKPVGEPPVVNHKEFVEVCKMIKAENLEKADVADLIMHQCAIKPNVLQVCRLIAGMSVTRFNLDSSYLLREKKLCQCAKDELGYHKLLDDEKEENLDGTVNGKYGQPLLSTKNLKTRLKNIKEAKNYMSKYENDSKKEKLYLKNKEIVRVEQEKLEKQRNIIKTILEDVDQKCGLFEKILELASDEEEAIVKKLKALDERDSGQAEAKRRGHGAELMLAKVLEKLQVNYSPENKIKRPMGGDIRLDKKTFDDVTNAPDLEEGATMSFDLVIKDDNDKPKICIISLIHTSNPGQYGKDKVETTKTGYKEPIDEYNFEKNTKIKLIGMADGNGFSMSPKNIEKLIDNTDNIIQIKTLWKIAVLLHEEGIIKLKAIRFNCEFYDDGEIAEWKSEMEQLGIKVIEKNDDKLKEIQAGTAWVYIEN